MNTTATLRRLALACVIASPGLLSSQTLFLSWADQFGGTGYDYVTNICTDNGGNVYSTGVFRNTVDFDPGSGTSNLTAAGAQDVFVSKVDQNGQLVWAVKVGGSGIDLGNEIAFDAAGNVFVAGSFEGTVDFDPGAGTANLTSQTAASSFILKLNASGTYAWAKTIGSNLGTSAEGLTVSAGGVVHVGGNFAGTADLDPGAGTTTAITTGNIDVYLVELDSSGDFNWGIDFGSSGLDGCAALAEDANGSIYMTGYFVNTCDFDPTASTTSLSATGNDAFVTKYNSNGNLTWASKLGGGGTDGAADMLVDAGGKVYTCGYFDGTCDFDPGNGTVNFTAGTGISDGFVSCLNANGSYSWAAQLGGPSVDVAQSICIDASGNIYTTGRFSGTADFDPSGTTSSLTSAGVEDVFVSKLSASGAFVSAHKFGGVSNDNGLAIYWNSDNSICVSGYFNSSTDVDPQPSAWTLTSLGQDDGYLVKFTQSGVGIEESSAHNSLFAFPNPTAGWVTISGVDVSNGGTVGVLTIAGEVLKQEQLVPGELIMLDLSGYAAGAYVVEVLTAEGTFHTQVLR